MIPLEIVLLFVMKIYSHIALDLTLCLFFLGFLILIHGKLVYEFVEVIINTMLIYLELIFYPLHQNVEGPLFVKSNLV